MKTHSSRAYESICGSEVWCRPIGLLYWKTYELPALIVRPFNNYGPYQHLESDTALYYQLYPQ